jgi:hypothetical protein
VNFIFLSNGARNQEIWYTTDAMGDQVVSQDLMIRTIASITVVIAVGVRRPAREIAKELAAVKSRFGRTLLGFFSPPLANAPSLRGTEHSSRTVWLVI